MMLVAVVLASNRPLLAPLAGDVDGPLVLDGQVFSPLIAGDVTGFYDWLRAPDAIEPAIVGVRYHLFESGTSDPAWDDLASAAMRTTYAVVDATRRTVELTWPARRAFDPSRSGDQCFGGNRYLRSASGRILLTFSMYGLTPAEQDSVMRACREPAG